MGKDDKKEEEKGFVIRDKRFTAQKEGEEESKPQAEGGKRRGTQRNDASQQEILFLRLTLRIFYFL